MALVNIKNSHKNMHLYKGIVCESEIYAIDVNGKLINKPHMFRDFKPIHNLMYNQY